MGVYHGLKEADDDTVGFTLMESDFESALTVIAGKDVPKRSRHIEIRLHWLQGEIEAEELELKYKLGTENCSDRFTKCLGTRDFSDAG